MRMREIKFRAWDEINNKWIDGCDLIMESNGRVWVGDVNNPPMIQIKSENVVFFTGLKDKNGKEIFDGDVVKNSRCGSNQLMLVKWTDAIEEVSSDGVEWTRQKPGFDFEKIGNGMTYVFVASKDLKIIGNIYENPELLGDSQ